MSAHTPGPWVFRKNHNGSSDLFGGNGNVIACGIWLRNQAINEALMAAAPDLLEALNEAYAWMETVQGELHRMEDGDKFDGAPLGLARAALAKATGGAL